MRHKRQAIVPGVPCGDGGNWDSESLHEAQGRLKESLNLELFRNVSVHEFYRLKALISLEQVNDTEWLKKKRILISKTAMVRCGKLSLYANESSDEHAIYFR